MKNIVLIVLGLMLFGLVSCSSVETGDGAIADRLTAMEAEVKALKLEATAREKAFHEELAQIRKNLEGIQELLKMEKGREEALGSPRANGKDDSSESDLDTKAKSFVDENLNRLMDITKKLLDKMEKELDEHMQKKEMPIVPEGDQI